MKFKVTVVEVIESVREVEANDYNELRGKLDEDRELAGSCLKPQTTEQMYCEIHDESGEAYKRITFIS